MSETQRPMYRLVFGSSRPSMEIDEARADIGRHPTCYIRIVGDGVSRRHARICRVDGNWVLSDLSSANGTMVNGKPVVEHVLKDGDRIGLASETLVFQNVRSAQKDVADRVVFESQSKKPASATQLISLQQFESLLGHDTADITESISAGAGIPIALFNQAAEALLSRVTLEDTLNRVMDLVFANVPAERGLICLYDETTDTMSPRVIRSKVEKDADEPLSISDTVTDLAIKEKQAVLVSDTAQDERFATKESILVSHIHSVMCAPLYREGHVGGFIYVDTRDPRRAFRRTHLEVLTTLALFSAVAVEQTRLREAIETEHEIRDRLSRYSSPAVVERIVNSAPGIGGEMIAETRDVSVIFADLSSFTSISEKLPAGEVTALLNTVFAELTDAVFAHDGTLDKFMGDGMMAIFGAPLPQEDHAIRAVKAGLEMQKRIENLNRISGGQPLAIRVGINSGTVIAGDIGSPKRKDYTVIGDTVNVASRLESSVAQPGQVVIGPETHRLIADRVACEAVGKVRLKGKLSEVDAWLALEATDEPFAESSTLPPPVHDGVDETA